MFLDDAIPSPRTPRDKNNDHLIKPSGPGPWRASILRFTGPFWERNTSTSGTPYFRRCNASDPNAIARIRVHVEFDQLRARSGVPLVLSMKYRASRVGSSTFAQLVAGLANRPVSEIATENIDLNDFTGRRVDVMLKTDRDGFARIASMAAIGLDVAAPTGP